MASNTIDALCALRMNKFIYHFSIDMMLHMMQYIECRCPTSMLCASCVSMYRATIYGNQRDGCIACSENEQIHFSLFNWYDVAYDALYRMSLSNFHAMCILCVDVPCNYIWHLTQWMHCVHWEWITLILLFNWYDVAYDAIYRMSLSNFHAMCILCVDVPCNYIWHLTR